MMQLDKKLGGFGGIELVADKGVAYFTTKGGIALLRGHGSPIDYWSSGAARAHVARHAEWLDGQNAKLLAKLQNRQEPSGALSGQGQQSSLGDQNRASTSSNFVSVSLPKGVSLQFPKNWRALSENLRVTLDSSVESQLDLSGASTTSSEFPFAANLYGDDGAVMAMLNVRYYPKMSLSQSEVQSITHDELGAFDRIGKQKVVESLRAAKLELLSWKGTELKVLGGQSAFVVEYQRKSMRDSGAFAVRLIRLFRGGRSFTVTVSHRVSASTLLRPITDRIIATIRCE